MRAYVANMPVSEPIGSTDSGNLANAPTATTARMLRMAATRRSRISASAVKLDSRCASTGLAASAVARHALPALTARHDPGGKPSGARFFASQAYDDAAGGALALCYCKAPAVGPQARGLRGL